MSHGKYLSLEEARKKDKRNKDKIDRFAKDHSSKGNEQDFDGTLTATGGTVLDPFMGSGSTLLTVRAVGRQAIGIETAEKSCEIAVNRLRLVQEVLF